MLDNETMKEYVVTLRNYDDLESFYEDMETVGGNLHIPGRAVDVCKRRAISRSTHYFLTDAEADTVRSDPRVLRVSLTMEEMGIEAHPTWAQEGEWSKDLDAPLSQHRNWGLLRCVEGNTLPNWGVGGTTTVVDTVRTTSSGKHVDVVIVDGHLDPSHPEFAVNSDGTGGSRVNLYNWFSLNQELGIGSNSTYQYSPHDFIVKDSHGMHVAGTAAGNSQGWARDSTIYNISPYSGHADANAYFIDYIRLWHRKKSVDPVTGRKRPTIVNNSYEFRASTFIPFITTIVYRGVSYSAPFSNNQLLSFGFGINSRNEVTYVFGGGFVIGEDYADAIEDGIIMVVAAGNSNKSIPNETTDPASDYNNYLVTQFGETVYFSRGGIAAVDGVISVGAIGEFVAENKATYSNYGPRIDLYAPGSGIVGPFAANGRTGDYRNSQYRIDRISGTSMASPQVTGVLSCLAEQRPEITPASALEYLKSYSAVDQIVDVPTSNILNLGGSPNRYLKYYSQRPLDGNVYPTSNQGLRPDAGQKWPRAKIYRYGK